ncbi:MAG: ComEC family competence protein [Bacteroidales bacterium]|nr:ComEC family competence protein [Bacteroidales bacterium]
MEIPHRKSLSKDISRFLIIRILIGIIIGILANHFINIGLYTGMAGIILSSAATLYTLRSKTFQLKYSYRFVNGLSLLTMWISFGILITEFHKSDPPDIEIINSNMKYGVVSAPMEEKAKSYKTRIQLWDSTQNANGPEIVAYFAKDSLNKIPEFGDFVAFFSNVKYIENAGNPLEFNYKEYMQYQGIYCSAYIKTDEYEILEPGFRKGLMYWGNKIRTHLIEIYHATGISGQQLAILEALTLGYKNDLDNETVKAFQTSGAMHILAVSGLHTGIIMLIMTFIMRPLGNGRKARIMRSVIIIGSLWLFAAVTGFSNSVCRSALMFSLVTFGQSLKRRVSTFSTLSFSAVVLLSINPMLIFNVGFGLSYLAVVSIICIMPLLEPLQPNIDWIRDNKLKNSILTIAKYIIGIMLVSVAAQIGTNVLSIKTFNLFPVYFLITNLAVIPLSYCVMVTAIITLATSACGPLFSISTWLLKLWLSWLTNSVQWIESLPMSSVDDIFITSHMALALYGATTLFVIWIYYKKITYLKAALMFLIASSIINAITYSPKNIHNQIIIYNQGYNQLYSICNNGHMRIYAPESKMDMRALQPAISNARLCNPESIDYIAVDSVIDIQNLYCEINGKSFYILQDHRQIDIMEDIELDIDYLIISENVYVNVDDIENKLNAGYVIFDSSCSDRYIATKEIELHEHGIACHSVRDNGAFVYGDGDQSIWWY